MPLRITGKIVTASVASPPSGAAPPVEVADTPPAVHEQMHERIERPDVLLGSTYKIRSPLVEHALYVTINDIVLNRGTPQASRRPFEIFINSRNMDHFQWIVALTRILSAVFRKGGDIAFLVEELKAVFDPRGGYFRPGGAYMPSLVAEIGGVIETHLRGIGLAPETAVQPGQDVRVPERAVRHEDGFPDAAVSCGRCQARASVLLDGCQTCLACGYSRCG